MLGQTGTAPRTYITLYQHSVVSTKRALLSYAPKLQSCLYAARIRQCRHQRNLTYLRHRISGNRSSPTSQGPNYGLSSGQWTKSHMPTSGCTPTMQQSQNVSDCPVQNQYHAMCRPFFEARRTKRRRQKDGTLRVTKPYYPRKGTQLSRCMPKDVRCVD